MRSTLAEHSIRIALGLGSNLGDRRANLERAVNLLSGAVLREVRVSAFNASTAVDCAPGAPDFLNAALIGTCSCSAETLLESCRRVEQRLGRPRDRAYHSNRTIDIDILLYGDRVVTTAQLQIPHPHMHERRFVLQPLAELAPDWLIPGRGQTVAEALHALATKRRGAHSE